MSADARQEAMDWEATRRPRAGTAALTAAALTLIGGLLGLNAVEAVPDTALVTLVDALDANAADRGTLTGGSAVQLVNIANDPAALAISRIAIGLGTLGLVLTLLFLFRAVLHRGARNRLPVALVATGGVIYAVAGVVSVVGLIRLGDAIERAQDKSNSAVQDLARDQALAAGAQSFASFAALLLGAGMLMVCLYAMRAGLLTRFLGVLGMLLGGIFILAATPVQLDQPPIIRTFWLLAVGLLLLNRIPGRAELPPAWAAGEAIPWPSNRAAPAARPVKREKAPKTAEPDAPAPTPRAPHPSSKKRRKRRR